MDIRLQALQQWISSMPAYAQYTLTPIPGDASFRRYFRLTRYDHCFIVMDAPPQHGSMQPFVAIANALLATGLNVPRILVSDLDQGFLLLTDFGDRLYLKELNFANAEKLYVRALQALSMLQACRSVPDHTLAHFDAARMREELAWCQTWFLEKHLNVTITPEIQTLLNHYFDQIAAISASQPQVLVHRDYHSANLMILPEGRVGILDFQDAFIGPATYDAVSLLKDCYIDWPEHFIKKLAFFYKDLVPALQKQDDALYWRQFEWMGMQRHLKALMTFARKWHRDKDPRYLQHMPRTLYYLMDTTAVYPECWGMYEFIKSVLFPALEKASAPCEP